MASTNVTDHPPFQVTKDENHRTNFLRNLLDLQQSDTFTDFTIKVGETSIPCHKAVLSAACPYFQVMFRTGLKEAQEQEVALDYLDTEVVQQLVQYFYIGDIKIEYTKVKQLVEACELFQIEGLKNRCGSYLIKYLDANNCIMWCKLGDMYHMEKLASSSKKIMLTSFYDVAESIDFFKLELVELIDYIKDDNVTVKNEDGVLLACIKWVQHDMESRKEDFMTLVSHLRLQFCSKGFIKYICKVYPDLTLMPDVKEQLSDVFEGLFTQKDKAQCLATRKSFFVRESCLCILGGYNNWPFSKGWLYKSDSKWASLTNIPDDMVHTFPGICQIESGLLYSGGKNIEGEHISDKMMIYNTLCKCWNDFKTMPEARYGHALHLIENQVYLFGGTDNGGHTSDTVFVLDLQQLEWKKINSMMHGIFLPISVVMDIFIFVIMNSCHGNQTEVSKYGLSFQVLNTATQRWSQNPNLPSEIATTRGASAVAVDDMLYLVGGEGKICTQYNPKTENWIVLKPTSLLHIYGGCIFWKGKILLLGGGANKTQTILSKDIEEYDIHADSWKICDFKLPANVQKCFVAVMYL